MSAIGMQGVTLGDRVAGAIIELTPRDLENYPKFLAVAHIAIDELGQAMDVSVEAMSGD